LLLLESDKLIIKNLWRSFWEAIKQGLGEELQEPEDITGIKNVAEFLGFIRANETTATDAGQLYDRARLGFEQGTNLDAEFSRIYVNSTAERTKKLLDSQKNKFDDRL